MENAQNIRQLVVTELKDSEGKYFFVIQVALSSYPNDPILSQLRYLLNQYASTTSKQSKLGCVKYVADLVQKNLVHVHYAVWDYTLTHTLAKNEFTSWVEGIANAMRTQSVASDTLPFQADSDSYVMVTIALLSKHQSLAQWLRFYPEQLEPQRYFERKTLQTILQRIASPNSPIVINSLNAILAILPNNDEQFYSANQIILDDDWDYLRPVY